MASTSHFWMRYGFSKTFPERLLVSNLPIAAATYAAYLLLKRTNERVEAIDKRLADVETKITNMEKKVTNMAKDQVHCRDGGR
ncbi:hypothetical protein MMC28_000564 [Mycoblastus sanguinarius]|nr:hypothetical protein [Mycoblastus sanguinarius]